MNYQEPKQTLDDMLLEAQRAIETNNFKQAFAVYTALLKAMPQEGIVHLQYGKTLLMVEEFDIAIQHLTQACHLLPNQPEPLFALVDAFEAVNSIEDVTTLIHFLLSKFSDDPNVLYRVATYFKETGQLEKSDAMASRCIALSTAPLLLSYLWLLRLDVCRNESIDKALPALNDILKVNDLLSSDKGNEVKMIANYALGKYFEQKQKVKLAFDCWRIANEIQYKKCNYKVNSLQTLFSAIKRQTAVSISTSKKMPTPSFTPIFIIGLPRTGSTLLEQRLCKHNDVMSLGEQPILANQVVNFLSHQTAQPFPLFMSQLATTEGKMLCQKAAALYEQAVKKRQLTSRFVIDKLPANFQSLGLIKCIFPHAKIIHLQRNFADTALSIFKNHFAANEPYMCNLHELSDYYAMYKDLMGHWHSLFPDQILEIKYEALVNHPKTSLKEVLDYCELSHQAHCWDVTENTAANVSAEKPVTIIKTLSAAQVTETIHQRSVGSHHQYKDLLSKNGLKC